MPGAQARLFSFNAEQNVLYYHALKYTLTGGHHFVLRGQANVIRAYAQVPSPLIAFELGAITLLGGKSIRDPSPMVDLFNQMSPQAAAIMGYTKQPVGLVDSGKVRQHDIFRT